MELWTFSRSNDVLTVNAMTTNTTSECFVCAACATQFDRSDTPPAICPICTDDRQYVPGGGQHWTTHDRLLQTHHNRLDIDVDLLGVGIAESFGIPQRALLVPTDAGNILWDCVGLVTPDAVAELERQGGVDAIAISHPHFYSAMVEWSDAFGGVPIHLHKADERWIQRHSPNIRLWDGDELVMSPTVRLIHLPGHFPGSAVLHWTAGPDGRRMLLVGDSLHVAADRSHVTVMHSVPNYIPVGPQVVRDVRARLDGVEFDDLYGFTWGRNIIGDARTAVDESLDRYLAAIADPASAA